MRFGNTYWSLMRKHHKSRELKLISCVPNMKTLKCMKTIDDMITKFTKIINGLASLGDEINNDQKV